MKKLSIKLFGTLALLLFLVSGSNALTGISIDNASSDWDIRVSNSCGVYYVNAGESIQDCQCPNVSMWTINDPHGNYIVLPVNYSGSVILNNGDSYFISTSTTNITIIDDSRSD